MPYLKVPYRYQKPTTVDEVRTALPADVAGLTVDLDLGFPCVEFPGTANAATITEVERELLNKGFTVY